MQSFIRDLFIGAALIGALFAAGAARADDVTIYRCVDAAGKVALQDRPCPKDVHQDVRQMIRPVDAPPRAEPINVVAPPPRAIEVHVVHDRDPQPAYRCTTPDGDTYISRTGIPQGHYVPLWTFGFGHGNGFMNGGGRPPQPMPQHGTFQGGSFGFPVMTYVEDTCVRMPQDEVCDSLHARNEQLGTLIFNGQPSDRERYERERKGLQEQMQSDCSAN
jgi:hypothetical protein